MAICGQLNINKATYEKSYVKVLSFNHIPNIGEKKYKTFLTYNIYADEEKDVLVCGGIHDFENDFCEISFQKCYAELKDMQDFIGFIDC